jgi:hypothetical protein
LSSSGFRVPAILAAAAAIAAFAACGDDGGDDAGPAALVPADAPAYVELAVQPEGEAADDAEAALGKVTGSDDPGGDLAALFERATDGPPGGFEDQIEPWLGERLGVYPSTLAGDTETVLVIETTDPEEAEEAFADETESEEEYEGHTFRIESDGDGVTLIDDFLVFGPPAGLRQVVDVAEGGDALGESDTYTDAVDDLPDDRLATVFALPRTFLEAIPEREIDSEGRGIILEAMGEAADEPFLGDLTASEDHLTLELSAGGGAVETTESDLLGRVPSDSWLAVALADIGTAVQNSTEQIDSAGVPGLSAETLRRQVQSETGIDLEREVIGALGDGAAFVQGTSEDSLGGAVVIESSDPDASADLIGKVQDLISREAPELEVEPLASTGGDQGFQVTLPGGDVEVSGGEPGEPASASITPSPGQPVTVIQRDDRIVIGYGGQALNQALSADGAEPLDQTELFRRARDAAGDLEIDAFAAIAPLLRVAESLGLAEDPGYSQVKPYLAALDFLSVAAGADGDRGIVQLTFGLTE